MNRPISVVIPTRNRLDYLERAVRSAIDQTMPPSEIIVVDDCSDIDILNFISSKFGSRVHVVRHDMRKGAPAARNTGFHIAKGELICFLDDDDLWLPEKLEKQLGLFENFGSELDLVFCGEALVTDCHILRNVPAHWDKSSRLLMLKRNVVGGTSTAMVRKESLLSHEGFDESLPACQDWDLWLRIVLDGKVACVEEILVHRTIHGNQISSTVKKRIRGRESFLNKHRNEISVYPSTLAHHLRRIGCLHATAGHKYKARDNFLNALKTRPGSFNSWVCLVVHCFFPQFLALKILTHYAVSKFGNLRIYH